MYEFNIFVNSSGFSLWRTRVLAVRPWLKAFIELVARPWGVFGPRDLAPLIRADSALVRFDISFETLFTAEARRRREKQKKVELEQGAGSDYWGLLFCAAPAGQGCG